MTHEPGSVDKGNAEFDVSSQSALLGRAITTVLARSAVLVASFVFAITVARLLTPAGRGNFALLQALNGITAVGANLAIQGALIHALGRRRLDHRRAMGSALVLAGLSGAAAAAIAVPMAIILQADLFSSLTTGLLVAAILLCTPVLVREYVGGIIIAAGKSITYVASLAAQPAGALLLLIPALVVTRDNLIGVCLAWGAGIVLSALILMGASIRTFQWPRFRTSDARQLSHFGIRTYPAIVARFMNLRLDQFLVAALTSTSVLGTYAVAVNLGELLLQIPVAMLWSVSGAIGSATHHESARLVQQFCKWALLVVTIASVLLALMAPIAIPFVFGQEYRDSVASVWALLPGMICYAPALIIAEYFIVQRAQPMRSMTIASLSVVTNIAANLLITPHLGAVGAGISTSVSYLAMLMIAAVLFVRDTKTSVLNLLRPSRHDLTAIGSLIAQARSGRIPRTSSPENFEIEP